MKKEEVKLVKKTKKSYRVARPNQTGFSSPATHYTEPRIDLNDALIENPSSTFYVRVSDNSFSEFEIFEKDVLIIDKSLTPKNNQLAVVVQEGCFQINRIACNSKEEIQLWGVITYIIKSAL
ncbi:S24 family peptidase [Polaribacter cellanae]|uniref:Peptidase S24 n=1 Tax=Polaribacter cellanae TaxID=2818493 RepID=A0A975CKR9_9FLAO|nr:S24 family peptidase [Polaribacter cellanae]QTE21711.1 peptidase S24 [Polaribacter cellanae]